VSKAAFQHFFRHYTSKPSQHHFSEKEQNRLAIAKPFIRTRLGQVTRTLLYRSRLEVIKQDVFRKSLKAFKMYLFLD